jgi:hypothetical protein
MNIMSATVAATSNCRGAATAPDPRLSFMARAAARLILVEAELMDIGEAFDGLIEAFEALAPCQCGREILDRWDRNDRQRGRRR